MRRYMHGCVWERGEEGVGENQDTNRQIKTELSPKISAISLNGSDLNMPISCLEGRIKIIDQMYALWWETYFKHSDISGYALNTHKKGESYMVQTLMG